MPTIESFIHAAPQSPGIGGPPNVTTEEQVEASLIAIIRANRDQPRLRLFASDCAERVLHLHERQEGASPIPRQSIALAREAAHNRAAPGEMLEFWLKYPIVTQPWSAFASAARDAARATLWESPSMAAWWAAKHAATAVGLHARSISFWQQAGFIDQRCNASDAVAHRQEQEAQLDLLLAYFPAEDGGRAA